MKGIAYGVGIGPGDPELMTLKACRLIRENEVIAVPGKEPKDSIAYKIAVQAVPELAGKKLIPIFMPMVKDRQTLHRYHEDGARLIESYLNQGRNVVYLTLGDSTIYCTFSYLQAILEDDGYETQLVSGIPSFCASASRLNEPIVEWNEPLTILPASHLKAACPDQPGTYVLMKSGRSMKEVKSMLKASGRTVKAVENCGMPEEHVYRNVDEIPDEAGYFSLIIAKKTAKRMEDGYNHLMETGIKKGFL